MEALVPLEVGSNKPNAVYFPLEPARSRSHSISNIASIPAASSDAGYGSDKPFQEALLT